MNADSVDALSLAGRCLIVGFEGTELDGDAAGTLSALKPAGVILFARNLKERTGVRRLMGQLRETCAPRLVCVDQEGGSVDRLRSVFPLFPSPERLAGLGSEQALQEYGMFSGEVLCGFGFNINFAPVLDLHCHDEDNALRSRYLGKDPAGVSALARAYLDGLQSAGVIGCGKHFPGLGRARLDTHVRLPEVGVSLEELIAHDLIPYLRLREHLKMVMVSHAAYPGLQRKPFTRLGPDEGGAAVPASCAPAVYQLLRNAIGFSGIAVTDDLEMGAVQESIQTEEIAVRAFRAGADLLLTGRRLDFALLCRKRLAALLEQPFWRQQALARLERLETVPAVPSVNLERIEVLEDQFSKWKGGLGLG